MNKFNIILKKYEKNGFVILKNFITKKEIEVFEKTLFEIYSNNLNEYINKKNVHKVIISSEKNKLYDQLYLCYNKYIVSKPYKDIEKRFLLFSKKIINILTLEWQSGLETQAELPMVGTKKNHITILRIQSISNFQ